MKILVFVEGTILMHKSAGGAKREQIVKQIVDKDPLVTNYMSYIPIGNAADKISSWVGQGAEIAYLTSRTSPHEVGIIKNVLRNYKFPLGELLYRKGSERYKDVLERFLPDVLIEDDCESIGGAKEMVITYVDPLVRSKIKSTSVPEFGGIDHLSDNVYQL